MTLEQKLKQFERQTHDNTRKLEQRIVDLELLVGTLQSEVEVLRWSTRVTADAFHEYLYGDSEPPQQETFSRVQPYEPHGVQPFPNRLGR